MTARVVEEARLWLGTPYRHQASTRGAGCDCLGLLRGVWRVVHGTEPEVPPYSPDWDEVAREDVLFAAAQTYLVQDSLDRLAAGYVVLFRMRQGAVAKHLGIYSGRDRFIHAYCGHGVVESSLSEPWRRRIVAVFRFPENSELEARG
ncbi:MAG: NlpC/P60 family protein [Pseudomonadota bacterium]